MSQNQMMFDPLGGITIVVQDEDERTLGYVKRDGTVWRATDVMGRDKGMYNTPQIAVLNLVRGRALRTGTK
jgi:hypothetical protein